MGRDRRRRDHPQIRFRRRQPVGQGYCLALLRNPSRVEVLPHFDPIRERPGPAQFGDLQRLRFSMVLDEELDIRVVEPGKNRRKRQPELFRFEIAPRFIGTGRGGSEKRVCLRAASSQRIKHGQLGAGQPFQ